MVEDDWLAAAGERQAGFESFLNGLSGDEPSGKAVFRPQARDTVGRRLLRREPKDQIS
jgi:hypothetical protein